MNIKNLRDAKSYIPSFIFFFNLASVNCLKYKIVLKNSKLWFTVKYTPTVERNLAWTATRVKDLNKLKPYTLFIIQN